MDGGGVEGMGFHGSGGLISWREHHGDAVSPGDGVMVVSVELVRGEVVGKTV